MTKIFLYDWGGVPSLRRELQVMGYGVLCQKNSPLDSDADDPELLSYARDRRNLIVLTDDKDMNIFIEDEDDKDPGIELNKNTSKVQVDTVNTKGEFEVTKTNNKRWRIKDSGPGSHNGIVIYQQEDAHNPSTLVNKIDEHISKNSVHNMVKDLT